MVTSLERKMMIMVNSLSSEQRVVTSHISNVIFVMCEVKNDDDGE